MNGFSYGCIGRKLTHSYSVPIHSMLAGYEYKLLPMEPDELDLFMREHKWNGINVTIPYKRDVIPYLDFIDGPAQEIGAVNTIVNRNGKLYGYNTDAYGLTQLLKRAGIEIKNRKVLILGTGGTSRTAMYVAGKLGAGECFRVGRSGADGALTYEQAYSEHSDAQVIINCTPVGMFPDSIGKTPVDLSRFPCIEGVADAVYNPLRSALVLEAQKKGIKAQGGLYMLVVQAVEAVRLFTGNEIPEEKQDYVFECVLAEKGNIVLSGMPGSGKTTVGRALSELTGRTVVDTDDIIVEREGREISEIFASDGEEYFRKVETEVIGSLSAKTGLIIATGGGAVTRPENVSALKSNGKIYFLDRPLESLIPTDSRPLASTREAIEERYKERYPVYVSTADVCLKTADDPYVTAEMIKGDYFV